MELAFSPTPLVLFILDISNLLCALVLGVVMQTYPVL